MRAQRPGGSTTSSLQLSSPSLKNRIQRHICTCQTFFSRQGRAQILELGVIFSIEDFSHGIPVSKHSKHSQRHHIFQTSCESPLAMMNVWVSKLHLDTRNSRSNCPLVIDNKREQNRAFFTPAWNSISRTLEWPTPFGTRHYMIDCSESLIQMSHHHRTFLFSILIFISERGLTAIHPLRVISE